MNKVFAIAGALALAVTPTVSLAEERVVNGYTIEAYANLNGADLSRANLSGAELSHANLSGANLTGVTASNLRSCPRTLPSGWVCENNSLIQR